MRPRLNPDFARGLLAAYALYSAAQNVVPLWIGLDLWLGRGRLAPLPLFGPLVLLAAYAVVAWAVFLPSPRRLLAAFVLLLAGAALPGVVLLSWLRAGTQALQYADLTGLALSEATRLAAAVLAWLLFRQAAHALGKAGR